MNKPVIITRAPTGDSEIPTMSEHLPNSPSEMAMASIEARLGLKGGDQVGF